MKTILFPLVILFYTFNVFASDINPQLIERFKGYVRDIQVIAVDFTQIDTKGDRAEGKLLINKPYKFRCNYFPPHPLLIVGNKNYVSVYDYEMQQTSRMHTHENMFNFLLADGVDFDEHFTIEAATEMGEELKVRLYNPDSDKSSIVTFDKLEGQIKKLEILEGDEIITINFAKVQKVVHFDDDLFVFKNPEIFGSPARFTKSSLEKKYRIAS